MATSQNTGGGINPQPSNSYPELPVIPYQQTSVDMAFVITFATTIIPVYGLEAIRTTYCIFRNESGNGKLGVNNNYAGIQADVGRWQGLTGAVATCVRVDGAGDNRRFICFDADDGYKISFEFTCQKIVQRGMYIGAPGVTNAVGLVQVYFDKWVANPKEFTDDNRDNFIKLYTQATQVFKSSAINTSDVIKAVQRHLGLDDDGNAGKLTWGAIYNAIVGNFAETEDVPTLIIAVQDALHANLTGTADNATWLAVADRLGINTTGAV